MSARAAGSPARTTSRSPRSDGAVAAFRKTVLLVAGTAMETLRRERCRTSRKCC